MQALITHRNSKFTSAVEELLLASAAHQPPLDPVQLLIEATQEYLPVKPVEDEGASQKGIKEMREELEFYRRNPDQRPSINALIRELKDDEAYKEQIVLGGHKIVEAREGVYGESCDHISADLR